MSPKQQGSLERKKQIYQAAVICFNRKGYYQTTMDDIVTESGLSKGSLYWYFDSKKDLFISLLQDMLKPLGQDWEAVAADETKSATEKFRVLLSAFRSQFEQMVGFFGIVIEAWAQAHFEEDVQQISKELYRTYLSLMDSIIEEGIGSGEFQVENVSAASAAILTLFDGLTLAYGTGILDLAPDELLDAAENMAFRSLGVEP